MMKWKNLRKVITNRKYWAIIVVAIIILIVLTIIYPLQDYNWSYYTKQFGLSEHCKISDVIKTIGKPLKTSSEDGYTTLSYDGVRIGFQGSVLDDPTLCSIVVTYGSIKMIRNGISVGSTLDELKAAYQFERAMKNTGFHEGGYILSASDHVVADGGGIWIYYKYDSNSVVKEICVTDGLL